MLLDTKSNKQLFTYSSLMLLQVFFFCFLLWLQKRVGNYENLIKKSASLTGKINSSHAFLDYIMASGHASYVNRTIIQNGDNTNNNQYLANLIISFFNQFKVFDVNKNATTTGSDHVSQIALLSGFFYKFNLYVQLAVFAFTSLILISALNLYLFIFFLWKIFFKKNAYQLIKFFVICIFNLPGFFVMRMFDEHFKENQPKIIYGETPFLQNRKIFKIIQILKERYVDIKEGKNLIDVKNLSFSYNTNHNFFKHFIDLYKLIRFYKKIDEEDHLFSFKNFLCRNKCEGNVLKDLNFKINKNSFTVIIGPNGCGKSTLIKLFMGLNEHFTGQMNWYDQSIKSINKKSLSKKICYIPQELHIPEGVKIYDFLSFSRVNRKEKNSNNITKQDHLAILKAIRDSGCYEFENKNINELSGGQKQKVILASILSRDTDIIILDEPIVFFDLKNQVKFLNFLQELHKKGKTIIMILHNIEQAANIATDLIVLKKGEIYSHGKPKEIVTQQLLQDVFEIKCEVSLNNEFLEISEIQGLQKIND